MVQSVGPFHTEPEVEAFGNPEILREGHVHAPEGRAAESVSSQVAIPTQGWQGKLRDRKDAGGQKLLPGESRRLDRRKRGIGAVASSAVGIVVAVGVGPAAGHAERVAIVEDPVTRELPSTTSLAVPGFTSVQERNVPVAIEAEPLRLVKTCDG